MKTNFGQSYEGLKNLFLRAKFDHCIWNRCTMTLKESSATGSRFDNCLIRIDAADEKTMTHLLAAIAAGEAKGNYLELNVAEFKND